MGRRGPRAAAPRSIGSSAWTATSRFSEEARAATRPRFAQLNWVRSRSASRKSPSSEGPACASAASRRRPGCRPRSQSRRPSTRSPSSASRSARPSSTSRRPTSGRPASSSRWSTASRACSGGRVEWVKGMGRFKDANTIAVEGGEDVTFKSAIVATGSFPLRPPIEGLDSARCVDSEGLLGQREVPRRLVILGGGIIGCEFASIFNRFGTEVTIIEMLPKLFRPRTTMRPRSSRSSSAGAGSRSTWRSSARRSRRPATGCACTSATARPWMRI